jgi:hypothetical protein
MSFLQPKKEAAAPLANHGGVGQHLRFNRPRVDGWMAILPPSGTELDANFSGRKMPWAAPKANVKKENPLSSGKSSEPLEYAHLGDLELCMEAM